MAEDKSFRYGLIVLGFFLIMIGMFIMNVDKPEVYATFCSVGVLMVIVGITWSICQCYPKITFVPAVESDMEYLFSQKRQIATFMSECEVPIKSSAQTPYISVEAGGQLVKNLLTSRQIQYTVTHAVEPPEVSSPPTSLQSEHKDRDSQASLKAEVMVHRDSESDGETSSSLGSNNITPPGRSKSGCCSKAPLAVFHEDLDPTISPSSSSISSLPRYESLIPSALRNKDQGPVGRNLPQYEDITVVETVPCETHCLCNQLVAPISKNELKSDQSTSSERQNVRSRGQVEDDMYYGLYDEAQDNTLNISEESEVEEYCSQDISV
uniref:Barttin CLCNK type accessory subunit beta n=1 Tax=Callorhinchus milii TaxID=7868 RepID=A0A4W3HTC0_CALMI|eukprot:gi/632963686/ref/XP_007898025.1/ PREDICTED: barttin [Callorhinchus milii]